jgi:hypothetical protein
LSVSNFAALANTSFGLGALVDDTATIFVQDDSPNDEDLYRARFYFDPNGFDPGETSGHLRMRILISFDTLNQRVITLVLRRLGGLYSLRARVRRDDGTRADTAFVGISDAPHAIEFDWRRATIPTADDGFFELFVDGASKATLTGLDNNASGIDFTRMGALTVKSGAAGTLRFDEFESRLLTYIGLVSNP